MKDENLVKLAEAYGTPLYIYDGAKLRSNAEMMFAAHKNCRAQFHFFEPANRNHTVLRFIRDLGFNITVVRPAGVYRALKLGFRPEQIEMSGFGLSDTEFDYVRGHNVLLNIGSLPELDRFSSLYPETAVGIRIDVAGGDKDKRGIPREKLLEFLSRRRVRVAGLHTYIGTNISDNAKHLDAARQLADTLVALAERGIGDISFINVGGGFGYDYVRRSAFDWKAHGDGIAELANVLREKVGRELLFKLEVGRALIADSACLVLKILHAFEKAGRSFVVVDSNISHLPRPVRYGFHKDFHPFMSDGVHRIELADGGSAAAVQGVEVEVAVVGNSHYSKDWLGFMKVPYFKPDELRKRYLVVRDVGAYVESMADTWVDEPRPLPIFYHDSEAQICTERETYADLF